LIEDEDRSREKKKMYSKYLISLLIIGIVFPSCSCHVALVFDPFVSNITHVISCFNYCVIGLVFCVLIH